MLESRCTTLALLLSLSSVQIACASGSSEAKVAPVETSGAPAIEISPEEFPTRASELLRSTSRDQKSKLLLAGIVQYQLSRASQLFSTGHTRAAVDVVTGALLLLRHDDEVLSATRGQGHALLEAAHAAARSGDAGRARALYEFTLAVIADKRERRDIAEHLEALTSWNKSTQGATALEAAGEEARRSLSRSVVDPRAQAYLSARNSITRWMKAALATSAHEEAPTSRMEREVAMEAYRAIRTGAPAMVALNLRQGTPASAVSALEDAELGRALPPGLRSLLQEASRGGEPQAWLELFRQLQTLREEGGSEAKLPQYVADGAALWAAIGLYRSNPGSDPGGIENSMPLAMTLVEFGMPEVASTLLSINTNSETSGEAIAWSVSLVLRGLLELSRTDQLLAARRSYREASSLLSLAENDDYHGPSPARVRMLMAALETRHGHVARALPLLRSSVALEAHPAALLRLAQLQDQQGDEEGALISLKAAISAAQNTGDLLTESKAEEYLFRSHRAGGNIPQAEAALSRSLSRILVLRRMDPALRDTAPVERQLASLLGYYGLRRELRNAYQRALDASRSSLVELEITLTDMARTALTLGDVRLGRLATQSALDFGLPPENSIYIALWQQLLEERTQSTRDGISREVLTRAGKARGWLGTLRKFGLGQVASNHLSTAASGIPENAEADFYAVLSNSQKISDLRKVASSPAVDLIEVRIAQDLLAGEASFKLPEGVELP